MLTNFPQETRGLITDDKMNDLFNLGFRWKVHLTYIHQNFPFALKSRVQSSHSIKMLPLTEVKGNC